MSATPGQQRLTLRRVEITSHGDGRYFARLLFLSHMKSDERTIGPFQSWDEMIEFVGRIRYAVEVLGKRAGETR